MSFSLEAGKTWERWAARLSEPGLWVFLVLVAGALPRVFWVLFSEGTADAIVWQALVQDVQERGMLAVYRGGDHILNHPPMAVWLASQLANFGQAVGLSFPVVFRAPLFFVDLGTFAAILWLFNAAGDSRWRRARWAIACFWWLSPLAMIFSSFHGNTDSIVALGLVLAAGAVAHQRYVLAGLMIGLGLWIKIPGVLAAPLLWLAVPHSTGRLKMAASAFSIAIAGYLPWLILDARAVIESVFFYPGLRIQTTQGMPIWGLERFAPDWRQIPLEWRSEYRTWMISWLRANRLICLIPIGLLAFARRGQDDAIKLAAGIAGTYAILYGFSNLWGFQYLAWSAPFWLALGPRWGVTATFLTTGYVYGLYAWLCNSWLLLGPWNFAAQPDWPLLLRTARDACILFFAGTALWQIGVAFREERSRWTRGGLSK
ncbi:MAG: hypothetical protein P8M78_18325 [Myxococcota bacterium]|nr:hypothetical protein [Myxococcota bacterium]